jgi:small subunit ribosomal protein S2
MAAISIKHLFEAGVHFGHKTRKWHPKMKEYIYGAKSGIYIIDLRQTLEKLKEAYEYVYNISANGGKVLFVGTKFQARDIIEGEASRSNNFFVNYRWLGGMLTNFSTIKQSIAKLKSIEETAGQERDYAGVLKKEAVRMERNRKKLEAVLKGIVDLRKNPAAIFIIDIRRESIAFKEAKKLGIPVIAVVDTNCNPTGVDYIIPGNDDSIHCIKLFTSVIASGSIEGRKVFDSKLQEIKKEKDKKKQEDLDKKAKLKAKKAAEVKKAEPKAETVEKTEAAKKVEPKVEKIVEAKKVEPKVEETVAAKKVEPIAEKIEPKEETEKVEETVAAKKVEPIAEKIEPKEETEKAEPKADSSTETTEK